MSLTIKSKPPMARAIFRVGIRFLPALAVITATALPARAQYVRPNLTVWSDLGSAVVTSYAGLANAAVLYPPGPYNFSVDQGYFTFTDGSEVAALTNVCTCSTQFGVMEWQMVVVETQLTSRVWLYEPSLGAPAFYTNQNAAAYDPIQWILNAYRLQSPPGYLTGSDLDQWYAWRDRSRFELILTFVNQNDWPTLQAAMQAATTNNYAPASPPTLPGDTNNMSISNVQAPSPGALNIWVYTPSARPVAILMSTNLMVANGWTVLGSFNSKPPFNQWNVFGGTPDAFYRAGYTDVDSNGDGLPDLLKIYVFGINTDIADTNSISDYDEIYIYGVNPSSLNTPPPIVSILTPAAGNWTAVQP
jgi:hypothetical protein